MCRESIEIQPDSKSKTRVLKHIDFMFPVSYDAEEGQFLLPTQNDVETVCLLSKLSEAKHHIEVKVDMDELDLTSAETKATYKEIQEWVQEKYGFHVTNLNIAQVKQKYRIIEREILIRRNLRIVSNLDVRRRRLRRLRMP